jgi:outer membrane protein
MKKLASTLALLIALISGRSVAHAAEIKIGYVDMQRAVKEVEEGKKAFKKLKKKYNRYQKEIKAKEEEVKKFQEEIKKQSVVLTEEGKKQKAVEMQRKLLEFQNAYLEKQRDLQQREGKLMGPIINKLVRLVQEMGATGEYTIILEKTDSRLLWAQQSLDITNELIRRFNSAKK